MKIQRVWTGSRVLLSYRVYWRTSQGNTARNLCQKSWRHLRFQIVVRKKSYFFRNRATLRNITQSSEAFSCTTYPCSRSFQAHTQCRNRQLLLQRQRTCKTVMCTYTLKHHLKQYQLKRIFLHLRQKYYKPSKPDSFLQTNQTVTFCAWVHPRSAGRAGWSACGVSNDGKWSIFWRIWWEDKPDVVNQHYWSMLSTYTEILLRTTRNPWLNNVIFPVI